MVALGARVGRRPPPRLRDAALATQVAPVKEEGLELDEDRLHRVGRRPALQCMFPTTEEIELESLAFRDL